MREQAQGEARGVVHKPPSPLLPYHPSPSRRPLLERQRLLAAVVAAPDEARAAA